MQRSWTAFVHLQRNPRPMSAPVAGPPPAVFRTAFQREPEGVERGHPEKHRERIDGHDERTHLEDRNAIEGDDCPERDRFAIEPPGHGGHDETRAEGEQGGEDADAKFIHTEEMRAEPDGRGDARPLRVIAEVHPLTPHEVVGLVGRQLDLRDIDEPQERECSEE